MIRCVKCNLPETHETISFDDDGVCNICRNLDTREQIDWDHQKSLLEDLIEKYRGKYDYDCLIPFSGGKDSTWTVYYLVKEHNIKPLVVRYIRFHETELGRECSKVQRELGVDVISFKSNWHVTRKLMLQSFLEKGDFVGIVTQEFMLIQCILLGRKSTTNFLWRASCRIYSLLWL